MENPINQSQFWDEKPKKNWQKILRSYAINPIQSKTDICKLTRIAYSDVYSLVDELHQKRLLEKVKPLSKTKRQGKKPILFGLSKKGLIEVIMDPQKPLSPQEFWNISFTCFNSDYKNENGKQVIPLESMDKIILFYLQQVLKVTREHSPILFNVLFRNKLVKLQNDKNLLAKICPILEVIGLSGKITINEILKKKSTLYKKKNHSNVTELDHFLGELVRIGLLVKEFTKKNYGVIFDIQTDFRYSLSHSGLILLIKYLLDTNELSSEQIILDTKGFLNNSFTQKIETLTEKNSKLLPMMFSNERFKKLRSKVKIGYYVLFEHLITYYFENYTNELYLAPIRTVWTPLAILKMMTTVYQIQLEKMENQAKLYLERWISENNRLSYMKGYLPKDFLSKKDIKLFQDMSKIIPYHPLANSILHLADDIVLSEQSHIDQDTKDALKRKMASYNSTKILYTIRKPLEKILELEDILNASRHRIDFNYTITQRFDPLEFETVGNVISFHFYTILRWLVGNKKWIKIFQNDKELKAWYQNWMYTLREFTKENLEKMVLPEM